jgi:hypothetical protein
MLSGKFFGAGGNSLAAAPVNQKVFRGRRQKRLDLAGFLKPVDPDLSESDNYPRS